MRYIECVEILIAYLFPDINVTESEFWEALRFRINRLPEFESTGQRAFAGWCDWFEPKRYTFGKVLRIFGRVGFVSGREVRQLDFDLLTNHRVSTFSEVEWTTLLPMEDSVGWLSQDESGDNIVINLR